MESSHMIEDTKSHCCLRPLPTLREKILCFLFHAIPNLSYTGDAAFCNLYRNCKRNYHMTVIPCTTLLDKISDCMIVLFPTFSKHRDGSKGRLPAQVPSKESRAVRPHLVVNGHTLVPLKKGEVGARWVQGGHCPRRSLTCRLS